uniref:Uncharacterized protein n=1 Tax=Cacopsylla melanoneura TaxID=428564 RepID=A0A8D8R757_9HEMI
MYNIAIRWKIEREKMQYPSTPPHNSSPLYLRVDGRVPHPYLPSIHRVYVPISISPLYLPLLSPLIYLYFTISPTPQHQYIPPLYQPFLIITRNSPPSVLCSTPSPFF